MIKVRVAIAGATGFGNAGDDLLASFISERIVRPADLRPHVLGSGPSAKLLDLVGTDQRRGRLQRYVEETTVLARCKALIIGGGGLFDDRIPYMYRRYTRLAAFAQLLRVPVMLVGVGMTEPRSAEAARAYRCALKSASYVAVRDKSSAGVAARLAPDVKVSVEPDLLYGLSPRGPLSDQRETLTVNLRNWPYISETSSLKTMGELIGRVAAAINSAGWIRRVKLVPMSVSNDDDDREPLRRLAQLIEVPAEMVDWNRDSILHAMQQSRCVLSMRLHGIVLSGSCRVPAIGLAYDTKVVDATHLNSGSAFSLDDLTGGFVDALASPDPIGFAQAEGLLGLQIAAAQHADRASAFLRRIRASPR